MNLLKLTVLASCLFVTSCATSASKEVTTAPQNVATKTQDQDDHCSYDFKNAKSALDVKSKDFSSIKEIQRDNKNKVLSQKAVLKKSRVKIEFTTGGCAHYGYSFNYSNLKESNFTSDQAFEKALSLLKATPTTEEANTLKSTLIENLEAAEKNKIFRPPNQAYSFPCGDAQCTLDASKKGHLNVSYSFAL